MKRLFALCLILFICFTAWVGVDRHRRMQEMLTLERQRDGLFLQHEMQQIRNKRVAPCKDPKPLSPEVTSKLFKVSSG